MSELILIRHGQASFGDQNYDKLSNLGRLHAQRLGDYWARQGRTIDAVFAGPRVRHIDSARRVGETYRKAGHDWPDPIVMPELDEHQVDQLVLHQAEVLARRSTEIRPLHDEYLATHGSPDRQRSFQRLFEAIAHLWINEEVSGVESWLDFRNRVNRAVDQVMHTAGRDKSVAVFTSAGPVTVTLQRALCCTDRVALGTGWRLKNASLTGFLFSGHRLTLDCFNTTPHLCDDELSFR